jgi:hypothetical protein
LNQEGREHFESVADSNHVVVRALEAALAGLDRDSVKDPLKPKTGLNGAPKNNEDPLKPKDGLNGTPGHEDPLKPKTGLNGAPKNNEDPLKPKDGLNGAPRNEDPLKPKTGLNGAPGAPGDSLGAPAWAAEVIARQERRIQNALPILHRICEELENAGCATTVMKSLDHWPDLGNDLDLYTTGDEKRVKETMVTRLKAQVDPRSWGDRLANKWNFSVPGLPELIEVHAQRLGQTGEQTQMAQRFVSRRVSKSLGGFTFLVPAPEERVIVATLQRMYRHFYFRVCDIVNTVALLDAGEIDYRELRRAAELGGIWNGVATYLKIVCDYVQKYRGSAPHLPDEVLEAARFGGDVVYVGGRFLRIPVLPNGADLYTRQVVKVASNCDIPAMVRLSLLPPLASAAALAYKFTGSDKGIW